MSEKTKLYNGERLDFLKRQGEQNNLRWAGEVACKVCSQKAQEYSLWCEEGYFGTYQNCTACGFDSQVIDFS